MGGGWWDVEGCGCGCKKRMRCSSFLCCTFVVVSGGVSDLFEFEKER